MIPTHFTEADYKKLAQRIASHLTLKDKYFKWEVKPARKGKIYGKGGSDKKPKFDIRIKVTATDDFKKIVSKQIENLI